MNKQASLLTAAAHTAEVSGLKQDLERAEEELGLVKKQLEDSQRYAVTCTYILGRVNVSC